MLIDKEIEVKIDKRNIEFYSKKFDVKLKDIIRIDIQDLQRGSNKKVKVICDKCGEERIVKYYSYVNNIENWNKYLCNKCSSKYKVEKIYKTNFERYGCKFFVNPEKSKQTNLERYGCENVSQSKIIKDKKKETNLKNWGTENVFQSEEIKNIAKKTKKEKYGDEHFTNREKSKQTCLKNNGVEWPTQSKKVLKIRNKNNKLRYGVEHYTQTKEYNEKTTITCLERYNNKTFLGSDICQEISKITCRRKYGVDYPSQNYEIHKKQFPKMKMHDIGIKYQGTYEKDFLDLCQKMKLNVNRGKTINFRYKNKDTIYFSDYYLKDFNLIVEIKSWYTYKLHKDLNLVKKKSVVSQGYKFMFITDKNYTKFIRMLKLII